MNNKYINKNIIKGEAILLAAAILWGSCFLFQKKGMDYIGPFTLGTFRFLLGGLLLLPVIYSLSYINKKRECKLNYKKSSLIKSGIYCGVVMFLAATFQQIGLIYTTSGKTGFITSMEIIVVAIITIFITRKIYLNVIMGIIAAIIGMYLLCITNGVSLGMGDSIVLLGSIFFGVQILLIDRYSKVYDVIKLSFIQFIVAGLLSAVCMIIFENVDIGNIIKALGSILYTAVIEVAVCYTLQVIGQKYVPPIIAAITLTLESVFAVIFGVIILHESISLREVYGCISILLSVVIVQIPSKINLSFKLLQK